MTKEIVEKMAGLSLLGYYDTSLNLVRVQFFGDNKKNDLVAYLLRDLTWELREVISETVELHEDGEKIEVKHVKLGMFEKGGQFDDFVRKSILNLRDNEGVKDDRAIEVLENGYEVLN